MLHVHGPGGVGKTTLLFEFQRLCSAAGVSSFYLDARNFDPSPDEFLGELQSILEVADRDPLLTLQDRAGPQVLLLDTARTSTAWTPGCGSSSFLVFPKAPWW